MNRKGFINVLLIVIVVVLAGAGIYFVWSRLAPISEAPAQGPITVSGEITCLPKKGQGVQTLECVIGLRGTDGRHYGLKNLVQHDPEYKFSATGLSVEVSGVFNPEEMKAPDGNKYDVAGTIDVTSIKEISDSQASSKLHPRLKELIGQGSPNNTVEVIINLRETASRADIIKSLQAYNIVVLEESSIINGFLARLPLKNIESIAMHPDVLYISPRVSGEPPPTPKSVPPPDYEKIISKVGEQIGSFFIQKINSSSVEGLWYERYPVDSSNNPPSSRTLRIGDDIGYACQGMSQKLTSIDFSNQTITFIQVIGQPPYGGCPICLASNTLIDTPSGLIIVKDLQVGMSVWTTDKTGQRVPGVITKTSKVLVPLTHQMVHLVLNDGRELFASPGHPTIDGRIVSDLAPGDLYDGVSVISTKRVPYGESATYDVLPSGDTGFYWANGVLLGSTLSK